MDQCIFKSTTQLCEVFWQDFWKSVAHKFFQVPFSSVRNPNYTVGIFWYQSVSGCGFFFIEFGYILQKS